MIQRVAKNKIQIPLKRTLANRDLFQNHPPLESGKTKRNMKMKNPLSAEVVSVPELKRPTT